jgi:cysteine desulfurase family protein (TIGR01976 family)
MRSQFPALHQPVDEGGRLPIFLDNPAGTQVPQRVIDAVAHYFTTMNANSGGAFATSQRSDSMTAHVRQLAAEFLNAEAAESIVIGPNMTTLCFALSRAIARTLKPGDEIVLTRMDHDANVAPWLRIAQDRNLAVRWVDIHTEDCTLNMDTLETALTERTKVVATVHASNAAGTINPIAQIAEMAQAAGALFVVDAVQSAPHLPIDVQAIGCDFLLCSAYKFFGPHIGLMYGRRDLLESLPVYKVRPSKDQSPYRWETGTASYETIAGVGAALDYLLEIGQTHGMPYTHQFPGLSDHRLTFKNAMAAIGAYETDLVEHLLAGLEMTPGVRIYGIVDRARLHERVPTVIFTVDGYTPRQIAEALAAHRIYVWNGNYYAVEIMARLGHAEHGMVRVGLAHYNTHEEIDALIHALNQIIG